MGKHSFTELHLQPAFLNFNEGLVTLLYNLAISNTVIGTKLLMLLFYMTFRNLFKKMYECFACIYVLEPCACLVLRDIRRHCFPKNWSYG